MKKTITRAEVIRALRTEPLKQRNWIQETGHFKSCAVCAVGAVLRCAGAKTREELYAMALSAVEGSPASFSSYASLHNIRRNLDFGRYLAALSGKFERMAPQYAVSKRGRESLVKFVKANFPKELTL